MVREAMRLSSGIALGKKYPLMWQEFETRRNHAKWSRPQREGQLVHWSHLKKTFKIMTVPQRVEGWLPTSVGREKLEIFV
jgi:hypothetical protein